MPPQQGSRDLQPDAVELCEGLVAAPLVSSSRHLLKPNGSIIGRDVAKVVLPLFPTMCSAIPTNLPEQPALGSIDGRRPISHSRIHAFVENEFGPALHQLGFGRGHRIALVLPNGPELALAIVSIANWASCVPLNANGAVTEIEGDLLRCGADLVIGPYTGPSDDKEASSVEPDERFRVLPSGAQNSNNSFAHIEEIAKKLGIPFVGLQPSSAESGVFKLVAGPSSKRQAKIFQPNTHQDEVLVLFTSGTTGNKKLVPHLLGDMLVASSTIAVSWDLTPADVNCNLMPLFHVGGIVRQVFSPILSGGCVICCPSFDPSIFWALLKKQAFTWYYAAPTMHQLILQTGREPASDDSNLTLEQEVLPRLRMIANAAGGLLPSLAVQLRETFHANVLPSYGMTECMPISSPPATYQLEKPGTSGVAVGPELAILNLATLEPLAPGEEGPICVRGEPCFRGYGKNLTDPSQSFEGTFKDGWFNTGDLGYMDTDGYLYITGRSKEVINRGGEIISPMEVEEEVVSHPDVAACAAISVAHDVLQEVVGIVVVSKPGRSRIDLPSLHAYLSDRLAAAKWPQCLIFMDGLPKSHTNKLLRVKLGERLGLPEMSDSMSPIERTFEAECPKQGTPLETKIPSSHVSVSATDVESSLSSQLVDHFDTKQLFVRPHPNRPGSLVCYLWNVDRLQAIAISRDILDKYAVPNYFVVLDHPVASKENLKVPGATDSVEYILQSQILPDGPLDPLVCQVQELFQSLLNLEYTPGPGMSFFNLGGSSMLASQLASRVRKLHGVACSGAEVFRHATCNAMADLIRDRQEEKAAKVCEGSSLMQGKNSFDSRESHGAPFPANRLLPQPSLFVSVFQFVPLFIVFPIFQTARFFLFFSFLLWRLELVPMERDVITFVCTWIVYHLFWITITPLIFVLIKWIVIGRYKAGRYPIWGSYYMRWWFVDVCRKLFLRGIWGSNEVMLNIYYRMLGAKIGRGTRISLEAEIAEYDLVSIGENAAVEYSTARGFGVDNGAMILGPVSIGNKASLGARSVLAPYTSIPNGCHLGPVTSSYDVGNSYDPKHAHVNRRCLPEPSLAAQFFIGRPVLLFVDAVANIPPITVLYFMLMMKLAHNEQFSTMSDLMRWLCDPRRVPFFIGIRLTRTIVSPFVHMAASILIKWFVIGPFKEGPRDVTSEWQLIRHWLAAKLFSRQKMQEVTEQLGRHYELVSCLYRLLGAKVGKRVFWPGHQPVFTGEFDLLEIGDDVVFGSRTSFFCTTTTSCEKVILCAGANVSDNCVVLPGSIVGKNAVLGSNSICPQGWYLPGGSVWFGSKGCEPTCLERGTEGDVEANKFGPFMARDVTRESLQMQGDETTLRPFGKAFYLRKAPYFVLPLSFIVLFTFITKIFVSLFHMLPLLGAIQGAGVILYGLPISHRHYARYHYTHADVFGRMLMVFMALHVFRVLCWLAIDLTSKWTLMGRRKEGVYNYDQVPYAQKWEIYQIIGKIRKFGRVNFLDFLAGTPFMSTYFRLNGCRIGKDCCLYPAGGDPYMPEPDLVTMGDRCVIDCASIVCHLNTRGNFELARIVLANDTTLRARGRVQAGVHVEAGAMLLEKSLAMTGEVVEARSVWQGGPASWWFQYPESNKDYQTETDDSSESSNENDANSETARLIQSSSKASMCYESV